MLFWKDKTEDGIVGNYADALKRIKELEDENQRLEYANKAYKDRLDDEYSKASYALDWEKMNAFSIERMMEHGIPKTVIGYITQEPLITTSGNDENQIITEKDIVREWTLYCSHEEHQRLVKEFNDYVKGGK